MSEPLTIDDFWNFYVLDDRQNRMDFAVVECPRCGALIKDAGLHVKFHNG